MGELSGVGELGVGFFKREKTILSLVEETRRKGNIEVTDQT